jgi:hypothetical protein
MPPDNWTAVAAPSYSAPIIDWFGRANQSLMPHQPSAQQSIPQAGTQPGPTQAVDGLGSFLQRFFSQPQQQPQYNPQNQAGGVGLPMNSSPSGLY